QRGLGSLLGAAGRPSIHPATPLRELLVPAARSAAPLPVVDEQGRLRGAVTRAALLAALAGEPSRGRALATDEAERSKTRAALPTGT
ncbi:MAG TPA: glycine/betaine ABC transporter ATP-binding protein, partial [Gammaproteobacteria bacterium]|nr:glycine/betaine ABC transporter ATP-binding protein [Gammaproteobacteria bacterium]